MLKNIEYRIKSFTVIDVECPRHSPTKSSFTDELESSSFLLIKNDSLKTQTLIDPSSALDTTNELFFLKF
jgi:hypothetical protein